MSASPTIPLRNALIAAIETGPGILAGDKVYLVGSVPRTAPLPYIAQGSGTETSDGVDRYNGQFGHENTVFLHCWGHDLDEAERVYAELKVKVDGVSLTIAGHGIGRGRISKVRDLPEPNPEVGGHQVVALLRIESQVAA